MGKQMILVQRGKHGDTYYDASTPEAKEAASISILRSWMGYYIVEPEEPMKHVKYSGIDLEQAALSDEQIADLPTNALRETAMKHKKALASRIARYESDLVEYQALKEFLENGTPMMTDPWVRRSGDNAGETVPARPRTAWAVLRDHSDGEYMTVSEEYLRTADDD